MDFSSVLRGANASMASLVAASADNMTTLLVANTAAAYLAGTGVTPARSDNKTIFGPEMTTAYNNSNVTTDPPPLPHSMLMTIILGILAGTVSIVTILGNIMVLLAFGLERTIRQPTNYFLASLAVSDLLIGTFSMPLYTQYLLVGSWPLGQWLCDLWLSLDWTVCLTSQYTVFLITMDRFLSVKIPAKYRNWRTEKKVMVMIAVTWIGPACVFFTSIIGWQYFTGGRTVASDECEVQFMSDAMFTFLLTIAYYWITLFVMCVLYSGIYKVALDLQRRSDEKQRKLNLTMELAGDGRNAGIRCFDVGGAPGIAGAGVAGVGGGSGDDPDASMNNSSAGDSAVPSITPADDKNYKQNNTSGAGDNPKGKSNRKSIKCALPYPPGAQNVNTTSFSSKKGRKDHKGHNDGVDDERSSSPAFDSDEENFGKPAAAKPSSTKGLTGVLFSNAGGLVRSLHGDMFLNTSQAANANLDGPGGVPTQGGAGGNANAHNTNFGSNINSEVAPPVLTALPITATTTPVTPGTASGGTTASTATTSPNHLQPPPYSSLGFASDTTVSDAEGSSAGVPHREAEFDSVYSSSNSDHRLDKQTTPLLSKHNDDDDEEDDNEHGYDRKRYRHENAPVTVDDINKGRSFIDEKSFLAASLSSESAALLPAMVMTVSGPAAPGKRRGTGDGRGGKILFSTDEEEDSDVADLDAASSPIWKRRTSLPPLASDIFDLEDDEGEGGEEDDEEDEDEDDDEDNHSDCIFNAEPTTTTTGFADDYATTPTSQSGQQIQGNHLAGHGQYHDHVTRLDVSPKLSGGGQPFLHQGRPRADTTNTLTSETTTYADTCTEDYSNSNSNASPIHHLYGGHYSPYGGGQGDNGKLAVAGGMYHPDSKNSTTNAYSMNDNSNNNSAASASGSGSGSGANTNNNNQGPYEGNEDSSRSESHCLAAVRRRRDRNNKDPNRLHSFVKSVRSRNSRRRNRRERKSKSENRARKALRTISFILGAFVVCWTPYHVVILVSAMCRFCELTLIYPITYWMCYLNSPINPFCYAFANAQFKRTFLRIMRLDWHRT